MPNLMPMVGRVEPNMIFLLALASSLSSGVGANCPVVSGYTAVFGVDHHGDDLGYGYTTDIAELSELCNHNCGCAGFNTAGYLKTNASSPDWKWKDDICLYEKQRMEECGGLKHDEEAAEAAGCPPVEGYAAMANMDQHYHDVKHGGHSLLAIAASCNETCNCLAFNKEGWLKDSLQMLKKQQGSCLYVRKSQGMCANQDALSKSEEKDISTEDKDASSEDKDASSEEKDASSEEKDASSQEERASSEGGPEEASPTADKPKPTVDEPKPNADEPKPNADEPKPNADEPKPTVYEPVSGGGAGEGKGNEDEEKVGRGEEAGQKVDNRGSFRPANKVLDESSCFCDHTQVPNQNSYSLRAAFQQLLFSGTFSDVDVIVEGSNAPIPAHSLILAARSHKLAELLTGKSPASTNTKAQLSIDPQLDVDTVRSLLTWMYTDRLDVGLGLPAGGGADADADVPKDPIALPKLMHAASMYEVPGLQAACIVALPRLIHIETAVTWLIYSHSSKQAELKGHVLSFVVQNLAEVERAQPNAFDELQKVPELAMELLRKSAGRG